MNKRFAIHEKPLRFTSEYEGSDLQSQGVLFIRKYAKLLNEVEDATRETENWKKNIFLELLEVVDSLQRILSQAENMPRDDTVDKLAGHIRVAGRQLNQVLSRRDVIPFETMGTRADAGLTEVVDVRETDTGMDEEVIEEIQQGYLYRGNLLRRAMVIVSKLKEE